MAFKSAISLRRLLCAQNTSRAISCFSTTALRPQQYFPINDQLFGLSDDIHQVILDLFSIENIIELYDFAVSIILN